MPTALPTRTNLSGAPSKATAQAAFVSIYDYLAGLFGSDGTAATARSAIAVDGPTVVPSVAAGALTLALKTAAGVDATAAVPLPIAFRSSTLASGAKNVRQVAAALSLVVPSGATLGAISGVDQWLYVYALDNAGTVELAITGTHAGTNTIASTLAVGPAVVSPTGFYANSVRTGVPMVLLASLRSNQTTAGTWAVVPVEVTYPAGFETMAADTRLQKQTATVFTTTGTSTAYIGTPATPITANTLGTEFEITMHATAGALPTLAVSGQPALPLIYLDAAGSGQSIGPAHLPAGWVARVRVLSGFWLVLNPFMGAVGDTAGNVLVGAATSAGSTANVKALVAGLFTSVNGTTPGVLNNTATTLVTLPNIAAATYLVSVWLPASDPGNYSAVTLVVTQGANLAFNSLRLAGLLNIGFVGLAVQVTQTSGATQSVSWSVTRIG